MKTAGRGVGIPWRHFLQQHGLLDGLGPGTRLIVGAERHGTHFAGPMTALAALLQNRAERRDKT